MRLRQFGPVLLVVLVVLAGCSGSGGQPYQTPLNSTQVEQSHTQALEESGSFTYRLTTNTSFGDEQASSSLSGGTTVKVDTESDALAVNTTTALGNLSVYQFGNGTAFLRLTMGDRTQYARGDDGRYNASQFTHLGLGNLTESVNFTHNGTATVEGDTVHEYVAHENQTLSALAGTNTTMGGSDANVTSTLRVYVRSDGLVKKYRYHVAYEGVGTMDVTGRYTDLGSTDVSPPPWLDDAKANTTAS